MMQTSDFSREIDIFMPIVAANESVARGIMDVTTMGS